MLVRWKKVFDECYDADEHEKVDLIFELAQELVSERIGMGSYEAELSVLKIIEASLKRKSEGKVR